MVWLGSCPSGKRGFSGRAEAKDDCTASIYGGEVTLWARSDISHCGKIVSFFDHLVSALRSIGRNLNEGVSKYTAAGRTGPLTTRLPLK
jgi:hypothetical protein